MSDEHHEHKLDLTRKQAMALMRGATVQLKHEVMGHGIEIHLPSHIMNKVLRATRLGKGMRLQLDPHSIHHNAVVNADFRRLLPPSVISKGEGLGRFLHNTFGLHYRKTVDNARNVGAQVAHTVLPAVASAAGNIVGDLTGNLLAGAVVGNVASSIVAKQAAKIKGKGLFRTLNKMGIKGVKGKLKAKAKELAHEAIHEHGANAVAQVASHAASAVAKHTGRHDLAQMAHDTIIHNGAQAVDQAHERVDGAGLFRTLHKLGIKGVKGRLKQVGHELVDHVAPQVTAAIGSAVGSRFGDAAGHMAESMANQHVGHAHSAISGMGRKRRGVARGKGFRVTEGGSFTVSGGSFNASGY